MVHHIYGSFHKGVTVNFLYKTPYNNIMGEKLLELVYNIAWDIDCIFDNNFVSDVNVVPTYYEIEYDHETNVVRIKHETVWDDV